MPASIVWNRKPLTQNLLSPLPPTAFRPEGWLRRALEMEKPGDVHGRLLNACLLGDQDAMDAMEGEMRAILQAEKRPSNAQIRALLAYHAVSTDKDVALYLLRAARDLRDALLAGETLSAREAANIGDLLHMALWLYNLTGQKALLEFCRLLKAQAPDWMSTLHIFPQTKAVTTLPEQETDAFWRMHGPTVAASLKTPGLQALFEGGKKNETAFSVGYEKLMRYHGAAHGVFNADPMLAGASPSRGVDPAVVRELLYTLRVQLWSAADAACGDLLERIAFGPLMATGGVQASNQLSPVPACTNGISQFAASLFMASQDDGLAAVCYAPGEVRWRVGGKAVRIETETGYPDAETVTLRIRTKGEVFFPLRLRIPAWAEGARIAFADGEMSPALGEFALLSRTWQDGDTVTLTLPMAVKTTRLYHQTIGVARGPLVYALPVEEGTQWRMALLENAMFETGEDAGIPVLYTDAAKVPAWQQSGDGPAAPPVLPGVKPEDIVRIALRPYGRTQARIAQFPAGQLSE